MLEGMHSGRAPVPNSGDFFDVFVTGGDGDQIPWRELCRIDDDEVGILCSKWSTGSTRFSFVSVSRSSEHLARMNVEIAVF